MAKTAMLGHQPHPGDSSWRLLRARFDVVFPRWSSRLIVRDGGGVQASVDYLGGGLICGCVPRSCRLAEERSEAAENEARAGRTSLYQISREASTARVLHSSTFCSIGHFELACSLTGGWRDQGPQIAAATPTRNVESRARRVRFLDPTGTCAQGPRTNGSTCASGATAATFLFDRRLEYVSNLGH